MRNLEEVILYATKHQIGIVDPLQPLDPYVVFDARKENPRRGNPEKHNPRIIRVYLSETGRLYFATRDKSEVIVRNGHTRSHVATFDLSRDDRFVFKGIDGVLYGCIGEYGHEGEDEDTKFPIAQRAGNEISRELFGYYFSPRGFLLKGYGDNLKETKFQVGEEERPFYSAQIDPSLLLGLIDTTRRKKRVSGYGGEGDQRRFLSACKKIRNEPPEDSVQRFFSAELRPHPQFQKAVNQ